MEAFIITDEGVRRNYDDVRVGAVAYFKEKYGGNLYVQFTLKRRQSVDTWCTQIKKAITSNLSNINISRKKRDLDILTYEDVENRFVFTYEQQDDKILLKVF